MTTSTDTPLDPDTRAKVHAAHVRRYDSNVANVVDRLERAIADVRRRSKVDPDYGTRLFGNPPHVTRANEVTATLMNLMGNLGATLTALNESAALADLTMAEAIHGVTGRVGPAGPADPTSPY